MKKRLLSLFLLFVLVFSLAACGETGTDTENQPPAEKTEFTLSAPYRLVVSEDYRKLQGVVDATALLTKALEEVCGITAAFGADGEVKPENYDILIGPTARQETEELQKTLKVNDYGYTVKSERCMVITGGSSEAILAAAEKFCSDILGYQEGKATPHTVTVKVGASFLHRGEYPHASLTLQGIDIQDYTVAIFSRSLLNSAQTFVKELGQYTGHVLPIVEREELTGQEKGVIMVGSLDRNGKERYIAACNGYLLKTRTEENGGFTLGVAAKNHIQYADAIQRLLKSATRTEKETGVALTLPDTDITEYIFDNIPQWTLKDETSQAVADGVELITRNYVDETKKPYVTKALIVDPQKVSLTMGTTNDGYEPAPVPAQTVIGHMQSAVANGKNVIAAVNADFFDLGGDNHPMGLAVKDGVLIVTATSQNNKAFFAIKKDGTAMIGDNAFNTKIDELQNAWGGRQIIVKKGVPTNLEMNTEFGKTAHPRTLVGIREDGKIILATIDGRLPAISNGASLANCALYMISLGAQTALNLDGGGSTTMVIREGDQYNVVNNLSGGALRKVYNSVMIVGK